MSRFFTPALFLGSVILALGLFFGFPRSVSREFFPGRGYAALGLEDRVGDRETALGLEQALGRPVLSESSQWVLLNSFGSLERIPLDEYDERLESFDPRRDPYAAMLRNFFVRDGKRWFFIPLDRGIFGPFPVLNPEQSLKKKIVPVINAVADAGAAYGGVVRSAGGGAVGSTAAGGTGGEAADTGSAGSFSLLLKRGDRPPLFRILPFALAWPAALFLAGKGHPGRPGPARMPQAGRGEGRPAGPLGSGAAGPRSQWHGRRLYRWLRWNAGTGGRSLPARPLLLLGPPLFVVSLWGAPGCALLALALYLGALLGPPLRELWVRIIRGENGEAGQKTALKPYRSDLLRALCLAPLAGLILWAGRIPPLPALLGLAGLFVLYFFDLGIQTRRRTPEDRPSCRFVPLPILPPRSSGRLRGGAPFALASCLAFVLSPAGLLRPAPEPWPFLVMEKDYTDHVLYQTGFSRRSLHLSGDHSSGFAPSGYFHYTIGEDGLVAGVLPGGLETGGEDETEIPPFPLAPLSNFLAGWAVPDSPPWVSGGRTAVVSPLLSLALVLLPPGRGRKKSPVSDDKRIAA
ncbi:MAG: hypothetical protein LBL56_04120 [Treponema sp.]|jgi:hypothetical protein|nr:hypothetical protein [Treponema sp.]